MYIGASLFLIVTGAILTFAIDVRTRGVDLVTAGVILMVFGFIGLLAGVVLWDDWRPRRREVNLVEPDEVVMHRRLHTVMSDLEPLEPAVERRTVRIRTRSEDWP